MKNVIRGILTICVIAISSQAYAQEKHYPALNGPLVVRVVDIQEVVYEKNVLRSFNILRKGILAAECLDINVVIDSKTKPIKVECEGFNVTVSYSPSNVRKDRLVFGIYSFDEDKIIGYKDYAFGPGFASKVVDPAFETRAAFIQRERAAGFIASPQP